MLFPLQSKVFLSQRLHCNIALIKYTRSYLYSGLLHNVDFTFCPTSLLARSTLSPVSFREHLEYLLYSAVSTAVFSWKLVIKERYPLSRRTNHLGNASQSCLRLSVSRTLAPSRPTYYGYITTLLYSSKTPYGSSQILAAVNTGDANRALLFGSVRNYDRHCQKRRLFATLRYLHLIHRSTLLRTTVTNVGA